MKNARARSRAFIDNVAEARSVSANALIPEHPFEDRIHLFQVIPEIE